MLTQSTADSSDHKRSEVTPCDFKSQINNYASYASKPPNYIPKNIFFIWIGDDIPSSANSSGKRPYFNNITKAKHYNPYATVQLFVAKKKLGKKWDSIKYECDLYNIELRDIETSCDSYLNYDIVMELMKNKENYVWASDILRLSIMEKEGGYYVDTDFVPCGPIDFKQIATYGFFQYYPDESEKIADFSFHAATKNHMVFRYGSVIARYFYNCVQEQIDTRGVTPEWLTTKSWELRHYVICRLSGRSISHLLQQTSLQEISRFGHYIMERRHGSEIIEKVFEPKYDNTWLDGYPSDHTQTADTRLRIDAVRCGFMIFYQKAVDKITEDFLVKMEKEYFHSSNKQVALPIIAPVVPTTISSITKSELDAKMIKPIPGSHTAPKHPTIPGKTTAKPSSASNVVTRDHLFYPAVVTAAGIIAAVSYKIFGGTSPSK
ncbi:hypothetical protein AYO45_05950 [Gammaproteobacteria bacterium SCGC AG-212-F23]|nr:hypothetical protein AYO45_05950 [Gammaproteobacteria bacterium SCGC AG-212-F23]